jgi:hypothetical protein
MAWTTVPRVGDTVTYVAFGGQVRRVRVRGVGENKGRPCFDGCLIGASTPLGSDVWGYVSQIQAIEHETRPDGTRLVPRAGL